MIKPFCSHCNLIWIGISTGGFFFSFPFLLIYLWKKQQIVHCGIPVSLQCLLKSCLSDLPDVYLFPQLVFQGVLKEKQQIMCNMEKMVSWVDFKKRKHKPTPPPTHNDSLQGKKKAFSLTCSDRSCIIKHTASVPLLPLCKMNPWFEKQKQTKLKAPSHRFVCKKGTVIFEVTMNYWNVYIPPFHPIIFEQNSLLERRQIRFSQATLWSLLHIHSIPSLTCSSWQLLWLLQKLVLELTRGFHGQRLLVGSGVFCQPLMRYWNPTDEHMLLTFGFLHACPFARLLRKNTAHCVLSYHRGRD